MQMQRKFSDSQSPPNEICCSCTRCFSRPILFLCLIRLELVVSTNCIHTHTHAHEMRWRLFIFGIFCDECACSGCVRVICLRNLHFVTFIRIHHSRHTHRHAHTRAHTKDPQNFGRCRLYRFTFDSAGRTNEKFFHGHSHTFSILFTYSIVWWLSSASRTRPRDEKKALAQNTHNFFFFFLVRCATNIFNTGARKSAHTATTDRINRQKNSRWMQPSRHNRSRI